MQTVTHDQPHATTTYPRENALGSRRRCGSKTESGSLQARINTQLNKLRRGPVEDREQFLATCPPWLIETFEGVPGTARYDVIETLVITLRETLKEPTPSRRFFLKALANYANARPCIQYATWNHLIPRDARKLVTPAAKRLWKETSR